jgi:hypothetical protein
MVKAAIVRNVGTVGEAEGRKSIGNFSAGRRMRWPIGGGNAKTRATAVLYGLFGADRN